MLKEEVEIVKQHIRAEQESLVAAFLSRRTEVFRMSSRIQHLL